MNRFARNCVRSTLPMMVLLAGLAPALAETAQQKFYHAFYLETARGNFADAADLYAEVVADRSVADDLRREARTRLTGAREEIASQDFARLMPENALVYVEMNRPGEQVLSLLGQLGLLSEPGEVADEAGRRVAISPALVKELLGLRGAAAALTGVDLQNEMPMGVAVLHPGNLEVVRGLLETALPAAAEPSEPIGGYPTYHVEGQVYVTLTRRLVVVSQQRAEIEGVIERLSGDEDRSLATNGDLEEVLAGRDNSLLFFCVNAKPILPLIRTAMAAGAGQSREVALANALLDPQSLRSLSGRAGVGDDGVFLELDIRLAEGHRNLVYNLMRLPAIDRGTLERVPAGAAGFLAFALSDADAHYEASAADEDGAPVVTGLDLFRELFANIVGVSVFATPAESPALSRGVPVPPVCAAITVHDPAKSDALWNQILGVASLATGMGAIEGEPVKIAGASARCFRFPDGITIYLVVDGNDLLISPSQDAIASAVAAAQEGRSILDDPAFRNSIGRIGDDSSLAVFVHPGRCMQLARQFMDEREIEEMQPVAEVMTDTVGSLVINQSGRRLAVSAQVTGIPDVSGLVAQALERRQLVATEFRAARAQAAQAQMRALRAARAEDWAAAEAAFDDSLRAVPGDTDGLRAKFDFLALTKKDVSAAREFGQTIVALAEDEALFLNNFAWALLTEDQYAGQYAELALQLSKRSNEITDYRNWAYVDTLARARFEAGNVEEAVELQKKAMKLSNGAGMDDMRRALSRYEQSLSRAEGQREPELQ